MKNTFEGIRYLFSALLLSVLLIGCSNAEPEVDGTQEQPSSETDGEVEESSFEVLSVQPPFVDLGDTLQITGNRFPADIRIRLNGLELNAIYKDDSRIECIIPYEGYNPSNPTIELFTSLESSTLKEAFSFYEPEVDSIPSNFTFLDTVVVYGKHLTNKPGQLDRIVKINSVEIDVIDQNKDSIRFLLPPFSGYENNLDIRAQLKNIRITGGVVVPDPEIDSLSRDSIIPGEEITIYGRNFAPIEEANSVYIGGVKAKVLQSSTDSLSVQSPHGPYAVREIGAIEVQSLRKSTQAVLPLYIKSVWYLNSIKSKMELSNTGGVGYIDPGFVVLDGAVYMTVYYRDQGDFFASNYRLFKFLPENNTWLRESDLPVRDFVENGEVIRIFGASPNSIYLHLSRLTENFFEYDLQTRTLNQLTDLPHNERLIYPRGFSLNNTFYMGFGIEDFNSGAPPNPKVWKYDRATDSWLFASETPYLPEQDRFRYFDFLETYSDRAYIGNGFNLWEFTPDQTWMRKSDLVNPAQNAPSLQLDGNIFIYEYQQDDVLNPDYKFFWQYDIISDRWIKRDDIRLEYDRFTVRFIFEMGDFVYMVGDTSSNAYEDSGIIRYDVMIFRTEKSKFLNPANP
ncbi:MAG: IPT/TIG domain-containing protein [Robiginitalea sp.]|nr:IPT/TIG domain-containing protein [Robiginitalea sp.]